VTPQDPRVDAGDQQASTDLERDARTARIFAEALARRRRKIARGEHVDPPFAGAVTHGT
jgi:hypothetical protein